MNTTIPGRFGPRVARALAGGHETFTDTAPTDAADATAASSAQLSVTPRIVAATSLGLLTYAGLGAATLATAGSFSGTIGGVSLLLFACVALLPGLSLRGDSGQAVEHKLWVIPITIGLFNAPAPDVAFVAASVYGFFMLVSYFRGVVRARDAWANFAAMTIAFGCGLMLAAIWSPWTISFGYMMVIVIAEGLSRLVTPTSTKAPSAYLSRCLAVSGSLACITTVFMVLVDPTDLEWAALPLGGLAFYLLARWRLDILDAERAWRHLTYVSARFSGNLDAQAVVALALEDALNMFSAHRVDIDLVANGTKPAIRYTLRAGSRQSIAGQVQEAPSARPRTSPTTQVMALSAGENHLGYLSIEWATKPLYSRPWLDLASTFSGIVGSSLGTALHTHQIERRAAAKTHEAEHDPLTGLGNRTMLHKHGPALISEAAEIGRQCALLLLDLDGFKAINDALGHAAGDTVIKEVAHRIQGRTRRGDLAIRLGGDEFAVLAADLLGAEDAVVIGNNLHEAISEPISIGGLTVTVEASIGIAPTGDGNNIELLLKKADVAMYHAKHTAQMSASQASAGHPDLVPSALSGHPGTVCYDPSLDHGTDDALQRTAELLAAIEAEDQLTLHYQPQVDVATGKVVGAEALVRWNHPTEGLLFPDTFVPLVERSDMIRPFTLKILEVALKDRIKMRRYIPHGTVSVNLSAMNLLDTNLPEQVGKLTNRFGVSPQELVLEITETSTARNVVGAKKVLQDLSDLGCDIAMDDFGSGYATLESLRWGSPVNELKIDRSFVRDIATVERDKVVTRAIVDIAHAWNCRVVAEGVEDEETYLLLQELNCDTAQGYWLSRPAPLDDIIAWIANRAATSNPKVTRSSDFTYLVPAE